MVLLIYGEIYMERQKYKKLTFEFPAEEYIYLKMACAKQGVSMKTFLTKSIVKTIEDYENELDLHALDKSKKENEKSVLWDDAEKAMEWDKL